MSELGTYPTEGYFYDYDSVMSAVLNYYGSQSTEWQTLTKYGLNAPDAIDILSKVPGINILYNSVGDVLMVSWSRPLPTPSASQQFTVPELIDSNTQTGAYDFANPKDVAIPGECTLIETEKVGVTAGVGAVGAFISKTVVPAIIAVSSGVALGVAIDTLLYNVNPDFWDEHNMSEINPETWKTITADDDSINARVFNMIFGIEGSNTQPYIEEKAYAYMATYLNRKGALQPGSFTYHQDGLVPVHVGANVHCEPAWTGERTYVGTNGTFHVSLNEPIYPNSRTFTFVTKDSSSPSTYNTCVTTITASNPSDIPAPFPSTLKSYTYDGRTVYYLVKKSSLFGGAGEVRSYDGLIGYYNTSIYNSDINDIERGMIAWIMIYGAQGMHSPEGIRRQDGGIVPLLSIDNTVEQNLSALKSSQPELWNKAVVNHVIQKDGSIKDYTYIPTGGVIAGSSSDSRPTTGDASQNNTVINPNTSSGDLLDSIVNITVEDGDPNDPPSGGTGETGSIVPPIGSASALFAVHNPTQGELNSFGAWLWSTSFVDQLLKLFNDPMQAIIGLHRVFVNPPIDGRSAIQVGYLSSGVVANDVVEQYTEVDCGYVDVKEFFGNVFDYEPFTKLQLFLPFIGIVPLNTGDVMRGRLSVKYVVDVLSGACIANVSVLRDGKDNILYTFNGNCAVTYPVSSGNYMGVITSALGLTAGVIGGLAGGSIMSALGGIAHGAYSALAGAHSNVAHSGTISGNSGACGGKKPYLIITRAQTNVASSFVETQGIPDNRTSYIRELSGFIKVLDMHITNVVATSEEINMIDNILREGIIV